MLLEFSCSNYKSIKEIITLSMLASSDETREEELIHFDKYRINRSSAIYGPNGSGKTTILEAINLSKNIVINSLKAEVGESLPYVPHKLSDDSTPTEFHYQFVIDNIRYAYAFSILNGIVDEELLFYFPNKRKTKMFSRKGLEVEAGDSFKGKIELALDVLKENRLFLSCVANYTNIQEFENAFLFFKRDLKTFWPSQEDEDLDDAIKFMHKHPELKEIYLKIVSYLGTGIRDVKVRVQDRNISEDDLPEDMPKRLKSFLLEKISSVSEATICYDNFSTDLIEEESTGIKKLFKLLYPILDVARTGKVLICDEIETGLHEAVVYEILKMFPNLFPNVNSQLIFTTHDTSLLDTNLFRRDQIWFTEQSEKRSTDLYSLVEIKNVRKLENLKNGYINGKYGAFPLLNPKIYQQIIDEVNSYQEEN